ncbi:MAG: NAD(P)-dependent oxidoreductase [Selenomonadaceae bacterium]
MKIVIIEPLGISEEKVQRLTKDILGEKTEILYYNTIPKNDDETIKRAQGAAVVMLANMPFKRNILEKCPKLKLLTVAFTGVDHVDMEYCKAKNIRVCNCSGYANEAVSELVFGMAIALYRKLIDCDKAVHSGKTRAGLIGSELCGKKFGIVGVGAIGIKTARLAQVFGCEVYAYSHTAKEITGVKFVDLNTLLEKCDIVSLHVPLTVETKGLINKENIARMKNNAILINTARGPVVDSEALAKALQTNAIAGAAIDVFENEPPINAEHVLLQSPHVLLAPHIGFATQEAMEKRALIAFENIRKWQDGEPQNVM